MRDITIFTGTFQGALYQIKTNGMEAIASSAFKKYLGWLCQLFTTPSITVIKVFYLSVHAMYKFIWRGGQHTCN